MLGGARGVLNVWVVAAWLAKPRAGPAIEAPALSPYDEAVHQISESVIHVVFSFFRKDKSSEDEAKKAKPRQTAAQPARPAPRPAPASGPVPGQPAPPPATSMPEPYGLSEGIEVVESCAESCNAIEEAAIYYANDRLTQAIGSLVQGIKDHPEIKEVQPWLMLFDLYQIAGMKQKFEELAMEFVVKFERSPPAWVEGQQASVSKQPEKGGLGNYFAFTGELTAAAENQVKQLQAAAKSGAVRLDLSKIQRIDADASKLLLEALQGMRKAGVKIQYSGVATLLGLLKQATEAGPDSAAPHWLLLLELYALQGKQAEFEDLAVEYAVNFEVSPPSWEQLASRVKAEEISEPAPSADAAPAVEGFALQGVISAASEAKLKELVQYAASRAEVHINMSQVPRVDFVSVGMFLNILIEISQGGSKKVLIEGANELINALFSVMGVGQFATILRKTKF